MIISPKTIETSSMERIVLTQALNDFIKAHEAKAEKAKKEQTVDSHRMAVAYAEDLLTKLEK